LEEFGSEQRAGVTHFQAIRLFFWKFYSPLIREGKRFEEFLGNFAKAVGYSSSVVGEIPFGITEGTVEDGNARWTMELFNWQGWRTSWRKIC